MPIVKIPKRPKWVSTGTLTISQAQVLVEAMEAGKATNVVEIGTASGYSTAVFASALQNSGRDWRLDTVDCSEKCYFDETKHVGQCIEELVKDTSRIFIHTPCTSLNIHEIFSGRSIDFAYIDGSHSSPWAAIDLLALLPNLREDALVAIDDIILPFRKGYSHQNASRDLFRAWKGPKWVDDRAPNLGLMHLSDKTQAASDAVATLLADWDEGLSNAAFFGLETVLQRIEHLPYQGKRALKALLQKTSTSTANGNPYLMIRDRPFVSESVLHPNGEGHNPVIRWDGLRGAAGCTLQLTATAFDRSPNNPGAVLDIRVRDSENSVVSTALLTVPPWRTASTGRLTCPSGLFCVEIAVHRSLDRSANFAALRLHRFALSSSC